MAFQGGSVRSATTVLTIGVFDGVHLGHQAILGRAALRARELGITSTALTFDPHPRVILGGRPLPRLMTLEDRLDAMRAPGIDETFVMPFDRSVALLSAREFFARLEIHLSIRRLVVGDTFRLGRGREAGVAELSTLGAELGWDVEPVATLIAEGAPVSSTRIRQALADEGDVRTAARLLGRHYFLTGTVVQGAGRGSTIGVPTANLSTESELVTPLNGVYYCWATTDGLAVSQPAVVNIGVRPTFGDSERSIEAHLLDWDGDLYGGRLRLEFIARLREERKFDGVPALVRQIGRDIEAAREIAGSRVG